MITNKAIYTIIEQCPLCGSKQRKTIREEKNQFYAKTAEDKAFFTQYEKDPVILLDCQNCSFCYVDKLPTDQVFFEKVYGSVAYNYEYEHNFHGKKQIHADIKRQLTKYCPSGDLLDIGTWCGTLPAFLRDTYSVTGCEISEQAANYAKGIGLKIKIGSFDSLEFEPESFDVITIIDVLEHLPNPKDVLTKIHRILKPGGIVYIKVPNIKAQINKQTILNSLGISSEGVCQNYIHINHFSHKSLSAVLFSLGFKVLEKGYTKAEIWDLSYPETLNVRTKKWLTNQIRNTSTAFANSVSYLLPLDLGFNIYTIAQIAQN